MKKFKASRDNFSGSMVAILALAGSAVGLGNLWRFPYLMGENGGGAFILIYLILAIIICIPVMLGEFIIGKRSQANIFRAYSSLSSSGFWKIVPIFSLFAVIFILSFYSVVGGWGVEYFVKSLTFSFTRDGHQSQFATMFSDFVSNPYKPLIFQTLFLILTAAIVGFGVKKGIGRFSEVMMPVLFILVIAIAIRAITIPGSYEGLKYIFRPDFSKVNSDMIINALGQAFFSLSVGCGTVVTYASYVKKETDCLKCVGATTLFDTLFALLAGCAIMPAVFAFGINPSEGPGLVFVTLPHIFSQMPLGGIIALLFFFALLIAALTSSISLLEVVISYMTEEMKITRKKAIAFSFLGFWTLGAFCSLSQGVLADFKIFGMNIFDLMDYVSANVLMLTCGLLTTIFVGWVLGPKIIREEMTNNGTLKIPMWLVNFLMFCIRFIAPTGVIAIMIFS